MIVVMFINMTRVCAQEISRNTDGDMIVKYNDGSWRYVLASDSVHMKEALFEFVQNELKKTSAQVYQPKFNQGRTITKMDQDCPCLFDGIAYQCSKLPLIQALHYFQKQAYTIESMVSIDPTSGNIYFYFRTSHPTFQNMLSVGQGITLKFIMLDGQIVQTTAKVSNFSQDWSVVMCTFSKAQYSVLENNYLDILGIRWPWGYIEHNIMHVDALQKLSSCISEQK